MEAWIIRPTLDRQKMHTFGAVSTAEALERRGLNALMAELYHAGAYRYYLDWAMVGVFWLPQVVQARLAANPRSTREKAPTLAQWTRSDGNCPRQLLPHELPPWETV